jgi:hypothetical protein
MLCIPTHRIGWGPTGYSCVTFAVCTMVHEPHLLVILLLLYSIAADEDFVHLSHSLWDWTLRPRCMIFSEPCPPWLCNLHEVVCLSHLVPDKQLGNNVCVEGSHVKVSKRGHTEWLTQMPRTRISTKWPGQGIRYSKTDSLPTIVLWTRRIRHLWMVKSTILGQWFKVLTFVLVFRAERTFAWHWGTSEVLVPPLPTTLPTYLR